MLAPADLPRLFERQLQLKTSNSCTSNPSVAELLIAIDTLDGRNWDDAFLILEDSAWGNAFFQVFQKEPGMYVVEYRDGATQLQYRTAKAISIEAMKLMCLSYMDRGIELMRHAVEWQDITAMLR
jgi:hypothetical protein